MDKKIIHDYLEIEFNNSQYVFDGEMHQIVMRALRKAEKEVNKKEQEKFISKSSKWLKSNADLFDLPDMRGIKQSNEARKRMMSLEKEVRTILQESQCTFGESIKRVIDLMTDKTCEWMEEAWKDCKTPEEIEWRKEMIDSYREYIQSL